MTLYDRVQEARAARPADPHHAVTAGQVWEPLALEQFATADHDARAVVVALRADHESDRILALIVKVTFELGVGMDYSHTELSCDELRATHRLVYDATLINPRAVA
jgi:hypothetical protein